MTRHQRISSILVFAAVLAAVLPGTAAANSLLSGYGGPGEGNQAILGSALLNTPKGGGGGSAGGAGGLSQASSTQSGEAAAQQGAAGSSATKKGSAGPTGKGTRATKTAAGGAASQAAQAGSVIYPAVSREEASGGSRALGLSGADFVYIILALGVLALTGFLTVRLTRPAAGRGPTGTRS
ncbi:MAG TPA: hypothetical protein VIJ83_06790 [Solirubrobacteraceae bacterium]